MFVFVISFLQCKDKVTFYSMFLKNFLYISCKSIDVASLTKDVQQLRRWYPNHWCKFLFHTFCSYRLVIVLADSCFMAPNSTAYIHVRIFLDLNLSAPNCWEYQYKFGITIKNLDEKHQMPLVIYNCGGKGKTSIEYLPLIMETSNLWNIHTSLYIKWVHYELKIQLTNNLLTIYNWLISCIPDTGNNSTVKNSWVHSK